MLILGPVLRFVDETTASVWVETSVPAQVAVRAGDQLATAPTFGVHGHYYALVELEGLSPGRVYEYTVEIDGHPVWPLPDGDFPASRISTLDPGRKPAARLRFLPHEHHARPQGQPLARGRRDAGLRAAHDQGSRQVARPDRLPR
ncbi:MAG: hypothetical protein WKF82_08150 [Nocardioidaceae bacterium]